MKDDRPFFAEKPPWWFVDVPWYFRSLVWLKRVGQRGLARSARVALPLVDETCFYVWDDGNQLTSYRTRADLESRADLEFRRDQKGSGWKVYRR